MIYPILIAVLTSGFLMSDGMLSLAQAQFHAAHKAVTSASTGKLAYTGYSLAWLKAMKSLYPNPYLSFLPTDSNPDRAYWQARMRAEAVARRSAFTRTIGTPMVGESEPNNVLGSGNPIEGFGNGPELTPSIDVIGTFSPPPAASSIGPFEEDDGAVVG